MATCACSSTSRAASAAARVQFRFGPPAGVGHQRPLRLDQYHRVFVLHAGDVGVQPLLLNELGAKRCDVAEHDLVRAFAAEHIGAREDRLDFVATRKLVAGHQFPAGGTHMLVGDFYYRR